MSELGWTDYTLPSRGVLYDGALPGGVVQLRKQTAREQAQLAQQGGGIVGKVEAVINACLRLPKTFPDPKKLLLTDRFAALLALRTKTFGPHCAFDYRCGGCSEKVRGAVNIIEDFNEVTPPEDLAEPLRLTLPDGGQTVLMRFLRGVDEDQIAKNAKRIKLQSSDAGDPSYLMRTAMQIVDVEGIDDGEREKLKELPFRLRWVEALSAADLLYLEDEITEVEPGIDTRIYQECPQCGFDNEMGMPFTAEFFVQDGLDLETVEAQIFFLVYAGRFSKVDVEEMTTDELVRFSRRLATQKQAEKDAYEEAAKKARAASKRRRR